jgi:TonB-dependent SusC/RagA subfamily outer membrane receptor
VEKPVYYFKDTSTETKTDLDLLMLTQGYRQYEWKQVLAKDSAGLTFQPEKGIDINGKVTNMSDKPISNGTVTLIPASGGSLLSTKSDAHGLFRFSDLVFTDSVKLVLNAVNAKGDKYTKITWLKNNPIFPFVSEMTPPVQTKDSAAFTLYQEKSGDYHEQWMSNHPGWGKMLKPVIVYGIRGYNQYRTQSLAGPGNADQVMFADEIGKIGGNLSTSLNGRLIGVTFVGGTPILTTSLGFNVHPMLVVLDGVELNLEKNFSLNDISTSSVQSVEVLKYASSSIYGMEGANGVLVITTKNGTEVGDIASVGVLPITPYGFYKARTFYSPKYEYTEGKTAEPELRSTIYWNPEIKTGQDGQAILSFNNGSSAGTYKVIVEGLDQSGNIGRLVYRYKVD